MESLGQKAVASLVFWGKTMRFSTLTAPVCTIPANSTLGFPFLRILSNICWFVYVGHSDWCEIVSHCGFLFFFSVFKGFNTLMDVKAVNLLNNLDASTTITIILVFHADVSGCHHWSRGLVRSRVLFLSSCSHEPNKSNHPPTHTTPPLPAPHFSPTLWF